MPISEVQEEEMRQLRKLLDERRAKGLKGAHCPEVRKRVVSLARSGVSKTVLSERLGIAGSMLYKWKKEEGYVAPAPPPAAHVMQVQPEPEVQELTAAGQLRLQVGMFTITVSLAGA